MILKLPSAAVEVFTCFFFGGGDDSGRHFLVKSPVVHLPAPELASPW